MLGIAVFFLIGLYLTITLLVVLFTAHSAKNRGRRGWVWGGVAAFVMYNLAFWDAAPSLVVHKYYCSKYAGIVVHKTPSQWAKDNPGVLESLVAYNDGRSHSLGDTHIVYSLNPRIAWHQILTPVAFGVGRHEHVIFDVEKREVLAREIYFRSGRCSGAPNKLSDFIKPANCKCANEPFSYGSLNFNSLRQAFRGREQREK